MTTSFRGLFDRSTPCRAQIPRDRQDGREVVRPAMRCGLPEQVRFLNDFGEGREHADDCTTQLQLRHLPGLRPTPNVCRVAICTYSRYRTAVPPYVLPVLNVYT